MPVIYSLEYRRSQIDAQVWQFAMIGVNYPETLQKRRIMGWADLSTTVSGQPFPVINIFPIASTVINESINNMSMLILDPLVVAVLSPSEVCTLRPVATKKVRIKAVLGTKYVYAHI
jgi:hypothetical protein